MADETNEAAPSQREVLRERMMSRIPASYSPWLHLAMTTGVGVAVLVVSALSIHSLRPIELLVIPLVVILSNGVEWRAHKDLLHHRVKPLQELYDRHTPQHHVAFHTHDMAIRSARELRLVLIPSVGVLAIVVGMILPAMAVAWLTTKNAGCLFLLTAGLYVVTYELTHLAYHLSPDSFIGRIPLIRVLRTHHARHHDPRLMQRWNFNVTLPLFDWLHGTIAKPGAEPLEESASAAESGRSEAVRL